MLVRTPDAAGRGGAGATGASRQDGAASGDARGTSSVREQPPGVSQDASARFRAEVRKFLLEKGGKRWTQLQAAADKSTTNKRFRKLNDDMRPGRRH